MSQLSSHDDELEAIELEFLEALDNGQKPTLEDYIRRYPHLKLEVTDFILTTLKHQYRLIKVDQETTETGFEATPTNVEQATPVASLADRMRELGTSAKTMANLVDVPVEIVVKLQRRQLREVPDLLVARISRVVEVPLLRLQELIVTSGPRVRAVGAFRAESQPEAVVDQVTTFEEEMRSLQAKKKVTDQQADEWLS